jgi:hypothetical protein
MYNATDATAHLVAYQRTQAIAAELAGECDYIEDPGVRAWKAAKNFAWRRFNPKLNPNYEETSGRVLTTEDIFDALVMSDFSAPEARRIADLAVVDAHRYYTGLHDNSWLDGGDEETVENVHDLAAPTGRRDRQNDHEHETSSRSSQPLYTVVTARESLSLPPIAFRVEGFMPERGTGALIGFSGDGKGVVSIDQGVALATSQHWRDLAVQQCPVLFIVGEGWAGIPQRIRACLDHRQVPAELDVPIYFIPAAPKLNVPADLQRLLDTIGTLPQMPRVVYVDTLSRTLFGNENLAEYMGPYCEALDEIAKAIDGFVITIHHTGWDKSRERASTVLRGAVDMMAQVAREETTITVSCSKPKDFAEFPPMRFRLQPHLESVVIVPTDDEAETPQERPTTLRQLPQNVRALLETLRDSFGDDGASASVLIKTSRVNERTFYRALKDARTWGFILKHNRIYQLTIAGQEILTCH